MSRRDLVIPAPQARTGAIDSASTFGESPDEGSLSVVDFGGDGPDILMVHSLGYCAVHWQPLAQVLTGRYHVYAVDLRDHGRSTAALTSHDQPWRDLIYLTRQLNLHRPLVVANEFGSYYGAIAAIEHPEMFRGMVSIGALVARPRAALEEMRDFALSDSMREILVDRFAFGETATGRAAAEAICDRIANDAQDDWLLRAIPQIRAEYEWSLRELPGDRWQVTPTPEAVYAGFNIPLSDRYFPGDHLCQLVQIPVWMVVPDDGHDTDLFDSLNQMASQAEHLHVLSLRSGQYPHCTDPAAVAEIVSEAINATSG